jgi:hypothetical protein
MLLGDGGRRVGIVFGFVVVVGRVGVGTGCGRYARDHDLHGAGLA